MYQTASLSYQSHTTFNQSTHLGGNRMSALQAKPAFGAKKMLPEYYSAVNSILAVLRPVATLRVMAAHLNNAGYSTPSGLPFDRQRLAAYLRSI
jgi:hypothetical protein